MSIIHSNAPYIITTVWGCKQMCMLIVDSVSFKGFNLQDTFTGEVTQAHTFCFLQHVFRFGNSRRIAGASLRPDMFSAAINFKPTAKEKQRKSFNIALNY